MPNENNWLYGLIIGFMIIVLFVFLDINYTSGNVVKHSLLCWGIPNNTVFVSLEMALFSFLATIYTNNRTLNLMKLSLTGDTIELKTDLESILLFYRWVSAKIDF